MKDDVRALLGSIADGRGTAAEHRKTARALLAADDAERKQKIARVGKCGTCDHFGADCNCTALDEEDD